MSKRFVSWAAVSSLPQAKKISLDDQLKTNREHIERHDGTLTAELVVRGQSRSIILFEDACARIEAYAQLRDLIKARAFDVLIYLDRSRLGRKASLIMAVVELCRDAHIVCYEIESPPASLEYSESTYDDEIVGAFKSVGAQREITKLQDRHRKGMIGRIKKGKWPSGVVPWGWIGHYVEVSGKRLLESTEIDHAAAATIRMILVDWFLHKGMGREQIAQELNAMGHSAPGGGRWEKANVQAIFIKRWRYAGFSEINRRGHRPYTIAKGNWPAIISEDECRAIEAEIDRRRRARRSVSNTYLFSGCVWCAACGRRMVMATNLRQRPSQRMQRSLRCTSEHEKTYISENKVKVAVRDLIAYVQVPVNRQLLLTDETSEDTGILTQVSALRAGIEKLQAGLLRVDDAYALGTMDYDRYQRQVQRLKAQIAEHETQIRNLEKELHQQRHDAQRGTRLDELADQGLEMLEVGDVKTANAWFRERIKIWVKDRRVVHFEHL